MRVQMSVLGIHYLNLVIQSPLELLVKLNFSMFYLLNFFTAVLDKES